MFDIKLFNFSLNPKKKKSKQIKPKFFAFGEKYKIRAVHQYEKSDDISGYKHLGQNSRKDQWSKLIKIESRFFNLFHEVIPLNKDDILHVVISKNGKDPYDYIEFNKS